MIRVSPSRTLRRAARRYEALRVDASFEDVVRACMRPGDPQSWIDERVAAAYGLLHALGWAHSVEAWDEEGLAGGLYGVACGGLFAAESMFRARTDASKAAFAGLVVFPPRLRHPRATRPRRPVADTAPRVARRGRDLPRRVSAPPGGGAGRRAGVLEEMRPMLFERPMKKSRSTTPSPTTETRS